MILIEAVLPKEEIKRLFDLKLNNPQAILDSLEKNLLTEVDRRISGNSMSYLNLEHGKKILETLSLAEKALSQ